MAIAARVAPAGVSREDSSRAASVRAAAEQQKDRYAKLVLIALRTSAVCPRLSLSITDNIRIVERHSYC